MSDEPPRPRRPWTAEEMMTLRRDYVALGPDAVGRSLGRSSDSVAAQARVSGLRRSRTGGRPAGLAYAAVADACRAVAGEGGSPPRVETVAARTGLAADTIRRHFADMRRRGDWGWAVVAPAPAPEPSPAADPGRIDPDDDPSPGEIAAIEARRLDVRNAKVAAEDAARLAWAAGSDAVLASAPPVPAGMVPWRLDESRWRAVAE